MAKSKAINLLPQEEFDASMTGRLLKWATGTFRIIVIITEMIVMGAFLSRFWLDAQNSDLTESINIKSSQIEAQADFENNFRLIQGKLNIVKDIDSNTKLDTKVGEVASEVPQAVTLTGLSVNENSAQIKGTSSTELGIAQFMSNFKGYKTYKSVDLGSINTSEEDPNLTVFTINITY